MVTRKKKDQNDAMNPAWTEIKTEKFLALRWFAVLFCHLSSRTIPSLWIK